MNNLKKKDGPDQDLRSFLKAQHRKVYSICRLFANNYKEHQRLFYNIIAAASQNIRHKKGQNKQTLILRACINMVALHSITLGMNPQMDRSIQFKSPDYQKNMVRFRESVAEASDYEKMLLFLEFEKVPHEDIPDLTGSVPIPKKAPKEVPKKELYPLSKGKTDMELKKLLQYWNSFPEVSMEERPVLSSDLEKIVVKNPLSDAFYLKNKIIIRIVLGVIFLLYNLDCLRQEIRSGGNDQDRQIILMILLTYFIYFHIRLLIFADYPALLALKLMPFLHKIETILDKYILSFGIMAIISGFYALALFEKVLSLFNGHGGAAISSSGFYKWLIIIFLSVSFYILFLHAFIPRYKKLLVAVRKYQEGITARSIKK